MTRLEQIAEQIRGDAQPPVHTWQPTQQGSIDISIDASGNWFHEGDPIKRDTLVRLFASILWAENGKHYLVTPAEKLEIEVQDAPYIVHQMEYVDNAWVAVTNTHEHVIISAKHPVELRDYQGQWVPYVNVRYDLWARVNRSIYYQWVDAALDAVQNEGEPLILQSQGYRFEVANA